MLAKSLSVTAFLLAFVGLAEGSQTYVYRANPTNAPTIYFQRTGGAIEQMAFGSTWSIADPEELIQMAGTLRGTFEIVVEDDSVAITSFDLTVHGLTDYRDLVSPPTPGGPPRLSVADGTPLADLLQNSPTDLAGVVEQWSSTRLLSVFLGDYEFQGFDELGAVLGSQVVGDNFASFPVGANQIFAGASFAGSDDVGGFFRISPAALPGQFLGQNTTPGVVSFGPLQLAPSFVLVPEPAALLLAAISVPWLVGPRTRR